MKIISRTCHHLVFHVSITFYNTAHDESRTNNYKKIKNKIKGLQLKTEK